MHNKIFLYIDLGTGSLIIQVLIAGVITTSIFFKRVWSKLFGWMKKKKEEDDKFDNDI